jgi:hypothetical protein
MIAGTVDAAVSAPQNGGLRASAVRGRRSWAVITVAGFQHRLEPRADIYLLRVGLGGSGKLGADVGIESRELGVLAASHRVRLLMTSNSVTIAFRRNHLSQRPASVPQLRPDRGLRFPGKLSDLFA